MTNKEQLEEIEAHIEAEKKKASARVDEDFRLLRTLMDKFGIDPSADTAYVVLAIVLARKFYPNGVRRLGRPRRKLSLVEIAEKFTDQRRGRPPMKRKFRSLLLDAVESQKCKHGFKGRGSDKQALEIIIKEIAADERRPASAARREYLSAWQKDLSRARKERRMN